MNETKKTLTVVAIIVICILIIPVLYFYNTMQGEK